MTGDPAWRWKVPSIEASRGPGLRYEPGNWGDLLKSIWALRTLDELAPSPGRPLTLFDPFAGRPRYPLTAAARANIRLAFDGPPPAALEEFVAAGAFPATTRLLLAHAARRERPLRASVFDAQEEARAAWSGVSGAEVVALEDGYAALGAASDFDLTLVDPYDLFEQASQVIDALVDAAASTTVLAYLYNKSPRGAAPFRDYSRLLQDLGARLDVAASPVRALVGRVPADARLPRGYHEMWLLAAPSVVDRLRDGLVAATRDLAWRIQRGGLIEEPGGRG